MKVKQLVKDLYFFDYIKVIDCLNEEELFKDDGKQLLMKRYGNAKVSGWSVNSIDALKCIVKIYLADESE